MTDLKQLQDEEKRLKEELARVQKNREQLQAELRYSKNQLILKNKDALLGVIQHTRTSCSDDNIANGFYSAEYGPRCSRCALLELEDHNLDIYDIDLVLEFNKP